MRNWGELISVYAWTDEMQDYLDLLEPALESPTGSGPADSQYSSMSSDSVAGSCQSIVHARP